MPARRDELSIGPFDPGPVYDTTVMLKPRSQWPSGMTYEKLIEEMDAKLQFPGLSNTWTSPIENRLDMELTGIKTPLGLKIQGPNLEGVQQVGAQVQQILSGIPDMRSIFAERVSSGVLPQRGSEPCAGGSLRPDHCRRSADG